MRTAAEWVLAPLEYDFACARAGIEQMPYPVAVTRHGVTMGERAELLAEAEDALAARGLWSAGGLHDGVAGVLRTVCEAPVTVDLLGFDRGPVRAVAGRVGRGGALVCTRGGDVVLRAAVDVAVPDLVVGLFPEHHAGTGRGMSVPLAAFAEIAGQGESDAEPSPFVDPSRGGDVEVLCRHGVPEADAERLCAIAGQRLRGGQFGITRRGTGRRGSSRGGVVFVLADTPSGRYLMVNDGVWVSVAPADARRVAARLTEAIEDV